MITQEKKAELRECLERAGFKGSGDDMRGNSPFRPGSDSAGFNVTFGESGGPMGWKDHVTGESGKLADLAARYGIMDWEGQANGHTNINPEYIYTDEGGQPIYKVIRTEKKGFPQTHLCPDKGKWVWSLGGNPTKCNCPKIKTIPYHLPQLVAAERAAPVIIPEGEKDVHTAEKLGFIATCNSGGAGNWSQMDEARQRHFAGRNIIVIADNDEPGMNHATDVASRLSGVAGTIKIITFNGPPGYDLSDWVNDGHDGNDLLEVMDSHTGNGVLEVGGNGVLEVAIDPLDDTPDTPDLLPYPAADEGNAQAFLLLHGNEYLYTNELGWLYYNGKYWAAKGGDERLNRAIVATLIERRTQAVGADLEPIVKATKPSANNVRNCKYMLQSLLWDSIDNFDNDPGALNCANGVVNLKTGVLTPHDQGQRFTYCLSVDFKYDADSTSWERWLLETTGGKQEIVDYMQMALGYSITGNRNEKVIFYLYGRANSGKGVFTETLLELLGNPLSAEVDFSMFTVRRDGDSQNFDMADLKPTRFVAASETNKYQALNPRRVKVSTGGNKIRCAHKHGKFFEYFPQFTIWLTANESVNADADDEALWERVCVIHFPGHYVGDKEDKSLKSRMLKKEALEGVLAWCVAGAAAWYGSLPSGLKRPPSLVTETKKHRDENDEVNQFLGENYTDVSGKYVSYPALYAQYELWCQANGVTPKKKKSLTLSLKRKGYETGGNDNRESMDDGPITRQVQVVRGLKLEC